MIKTREFSDIVGASYASVRQAYKSEVRTPRFPGPESVDFVTGTHRRFVAADVVAWSLATVLSKAGLTWEEAATVVRASHVWFDENFIGMMGDPKAFFTVWKSEGFDDYTFWAGSLNEAHKVIEGDIEHFGAVKACNSVSLKAAFDAAEFNALQAGYVLNMKDGEIYPADHASDDDDVFDGPA